MNRVVLDSYAVLALLENEAGSNAVEEYIIDEETDVYLSVISLGGIYYILLRRKGLKVAEELVRGILIDESLRIVEASWPKVKAAATIKAGGRLSYADSFVIALAAEHGAVLVTGDPEILSVSEKMGVKVDRLKQGQA